MERTVIPVKKDHGSPFFDDLVGMALAEYHENHEQIISELLERAEALINRIMPDHKLSVVECYCGGGDCVYCDVNYLTYGFGMISFYFHKGTSPDLDYFTIENYMELPSLVEIRTLYDLGLALSELTEVAQGVMKAFRRTLIDYPKPEDVDSDLN